jgi:hypothetical protein
MDIFARTAWNKPPSPGQKFLEPTGSGLKHQRAFGRGFPKGEGSAGLQRVSRCKQKSVSALPSGFVLGKLHALRAANRASYLHLLRNFLRGTVQDRQGFSKKHSPSCDQSSTSPKVHSQCKMRVFSGLLFSCFRKNAPCPPRLARRLQNRGGALNN